MSGNDSHFVFNIELFEMLGDVGAELLVGLGAHDDDDASRTIDSQEARQSVGDPLEVQLHFG